ncbi:unnamed protein product [Clonostachys rhizophaga]|uniref:Unsaturated rhamnogalacturonyl hydrolase YteR n=1 Tax=Clonostachys rhizophaga TaxID=160324 RepID=A0A9N9V6C1_9HYPO|nr:unnamed protein product [Clonostachys rhizophaga]
MRSLQAAAIAILAATPALAAPSPRSKISYTRWMTNSILHHGVEPDFHYDEATLYNAFQDVIAFTKNDTLKQVYHDLVDGVVLENGTIANYDYRKHSLDNYRFGNNILYWYEQTGDAKYKVAADAVRGMLDTHPRNLAGGFWHRDPSYPNQMWLDGIYMADTFYAKWTSLFQPGNQTAWDDIMLQFDTIDARTRKKDNNLLVHGYDESKKAVWADTEDGRAPLVWGRAIGWYFMSLLEVIQLIPEEHPGRQRLIGYFEKTAEGLKGAQDELGGWWNVMDKRYEDVKGNYLEASASVMFTFGWLRGLNLGLLPEAGYKDVAEKAYRAMIDLFVTTNEDGTINWEKTVEVGSLGSNATFEYYSSIATRKNDLRGAAVFMLASLEWEKRNC